MDGDGFGDLLVGAYTEDDSLAQEGAAYLFRGTAQGTSLTPAWRWASRQAGALAGFTVAAAGDVNGDGYGDVAVGVIHWDTPQHIDTGKLVIFHGGPAGLPLVPTYELFSPLPAFEHRFGARLAPAGDVNGDGFADLLVTGRHIVNNDNLGSVFVFHGSATGLNPTPARTWTGTPGQFAGLGVGLSSAGDVNADGFADVLVGAPTQSNPFPGGGFTFLYLGSAGGALATPDTALAGLQVNAHCGESVSLAGDVNGDGYGDVLFGCPGMNTFAGEARLGLGGPGGIASTITLLNPEAIPDENIGRFVATLGDLDGDGFGDFAVGARHTPNNRGRISVYRGGLAGAVYVGELLSPASDGFFGQCFGTAGDADGDGFAEIFAGSENMSVVPGLREGRMFQFRAPRNLLRFATGGWPRAGAQPGSRYGTAVAIVPQFDGVDTPQLVIGDPGFDGVGRISTHQGSTTTGATFTETRSVVASSNFQSLGARIVDAGDMNRDGFGDFAVSSTTLDNGAAFQAGRVDFHPGALGAVVPPSLVVAGTHSFDRMGSALAGRGDVNGDGFHDLVVGAREWDEAALADCGRVSVFFGSAGGPVLATPWTRVGTQAGQGFGAGVALTDLDADGYTDVVVGSSSPTFNATTPGRVEVFYGGPGGPANTPGLVYTSPNPHVSYGSVVAALGDVNADGIADLGVAAPLEDGRGVVRIYEGTLGRSQSP
ncbi:MAG: VCBS repeat-containing protein, partial [Candidatus Eisenbacteria bacterium]